MSIAQHRGRRRAAVSPEPSWLGPAVWGLILVWAAVNAWARHSPSGISWHYFADGSHWLLSGAGLHVYAQHPELQVGPLTLVAVAPFAALPGGWALGTTQVLLTAAGPLALALVAPLVTGPRRHVRVLLAGLVLMPAWTVLSVRWVHPDDVLALLLSAAAVRAVAARRPVVLGLCLAGAVACKPWAVGFLPLVLAVRARGGRDTLTPALTAAGTAAAGIVAAWAPFLLADPGTTAALHPPVGVARSSAMSVFGYHGSVVPAWTRTAQLLLAPVAGLLAVLRGRWPGVMLAAIAVRLALDPQNLAYYLAGAVLAAVIFDLLATGWTVPWAALVTLVVGWQPFVAVFEQRFRTSHGWALWWFQHQWAVGVVHLLWSVAAVSVVLLLPRRALRPV